MLRDLFSLFPAYAGVIPNASEINYSTMPFPRIRGGDPFAIWYVFFIVGFSPHTRG